MKDEPIDPRIEKLVASLYGELSESEEREFQALLAEDAGLRAEWEELKGTRAALRGWELDERSPSFVIAGSAERAPRRDGSGLGGAIAAFFGRPFAVPAVAALAAAILIAVLAIGRCRIERIDRGLAFQFGAPVPAASRGDDGAARTRALEALTPVDGSARGLDGGAPVTDEMVRAGAVVPVSDEAPYLTRQEFENYSDTMATRLLAALNAYGTQNEREMSRVMWGLYKDINQKQAAAYDDLRGRIDAVGVGLLVEQSKTDAKLEDYIDQSKGEPLTPLKKTPSKGSEER